MVRLRPNEHDHRTQPPAPAGGRQAAAVPLRGTAAHLYTPTLVGFLPPCGIFSPSLPLSLPPSFTPLSHRHLSLQLEFLSEEQREHPAIVFSIALDQFLMAGAYDQVLLAAAHPPIERFRFFLKSLMRTVRGHIVQCISVTYGETLRLEAAQERLMFDSVEVGPLLSLSPSSLL